MTPELDTQNLVALYDALAPITEPPAISLAPQTAGWWVVGAALLLMNALAMFVWRRHYRASAYRRAGLDALAEAGQDPAAIAMVLRRTALAGFPRERVASLHGSEWLDFLDATGPGAAFTGSTEGAQLASAPYRQAQASSGLQAKARLWIKTHKVRADGS